MRFLNIWMRFIRMKLASEINYKISFILNWIGIFLSDLLAPLMIILIYGATNGVSGWTLPEFLLMQGIFMFLFGFDTTFFALVGYQTSILIQIGNFDMIMIKPYKPLLSLLAGSVHYKGFAEMASGLFIIAFALSKLDIVISAFNIAIMILLMILAILIFFSLTVIATSLSFFFVKSDVLISIFREVKEFANYPLSIYGKFGVFLFSFVLPIGLSSYYPAQAMFGVLNLKLIPYLILVTFVFFGFSMVLWKYSIKHYTSAGG